MKSMFRFLVVVVLFGLGQGAMASLIWGSGNNVIDDFNSDPVPTSSATDPLEGAFAQLIRIIVGTDPHSFVNSGSGVSGGDLVLSTMYSGQYDDLSDPGTFAFNLASPILNGAEYNGTYYVRVFDMPQATVEAWNLGNAAPIPTGAGYYFESATYAYTHNELEPSQWNYGAGQTLNPVAIPEPGVLALIALGAIGIRFARKRR